MCLTWSKYFQELGNWKGNSRVSVALDEDGWWNIGKMRMEEYWEQKGPNRGKYGGRFGKMWLMKG